MSSSPTETPTTVDVTMPQMGVSVAEGTVVEWRKQAGDWVEAEETICDVSTDKIDTEVPSPASGRVTEIVVGVEQTVEVGTVLARIATDATPGQAHSAEQVDGSPGAESGAPTAASEVGATEAAAALDPPSPTAAPDPDADPHGRPGPPARRYSPVVQRIAAEHGVDLEQVRGTGRQGRVRKPDVLAFIEARGADACAQTPSAPLHSESPYRPEPAVATGSAAEERLTAPLSRMRRSIGEHMLRSLQTAPHCTTIVEADMSRIEEARGRLRLTYLPFVARCAIAALRELPALNATLEDGSLTLHRDVNLGVAVSLGDDGLIVPVVHRAHELSVEGLAERIGDLARRARAGELGPDEVRGGTFTITNPGAFGAVAATPIINQPQVAILDLEAVVRRPVVVDDGRGGEAIAIRPVTNLCMSWDHRALDGALAARFLSSVRRHLESFTGA